MPDEVAAEWATRLFNPSVGGQFDEVRGVVLIQIVAVDEPELDRGPGHALLEILCVEGEPVAEELDHVVLAG